MSRSQKPTKVSWAHAFRDIVLRALDRGQLLPLTGFLFLIILVIRVPSEKIPDLFSSLVSRFADYSLLGWSLLPVSLFSWFMHAKYQRRRAAEELDRVCAERTHLQQQLSMRKIQSSRSGQNK